MNETFHFVGVAGVGPTFFFFEYAFVTRRMYVGTKMHVSGGSTWLVKMVMAVVQYVLEMACGW